VHRQQGNASVTLGSADAEDVRPARASKLGEMYVELARNAYQPVEQVAAKTARKVA
jgi:hypothetical protein